MTGCNSVATFAVLAMVVLVLLLVNIYITNMSNKRFLMGYVRSCASRLTNAKPEDELKIHPSVHTFPPPLQCATSARHGSMDDPPPSSDAKQKEEICLIVRGQMFRSGNQYSRDEQHHSYDEQIKVIESIKANIIDPLSVYWDVVVIYDVITKNTDAAHKILNILKPVVKIRTNASFPKSQVQGWLDSINFARNHTNCSKMFIVRADLLFKRRIPTDSIRESKKSVLVPWQISERFGSKLSSGKDRVCDTFAFVSNINAMIDALTDHTDNTSLHTIMDWIDCDYIISNYARDSDSSKEFNDYYRMIGREEYARHGSMDDPPPSSDAKQIILPEFDGEFGAEIDRAIPYAYKM